MGFTLVPQVPKELPDNLRWHIPKPAEYDDHELLIAGPPISLHTHFTGEKTVPCPKYIEGCSVPCPRCKSVLRFTVYVPCYTTLAPAGKKLVVMGAKRTLKSLTPIAVGTVVKYTKEKKDRGTITFFKHNPSASGTQLASLRKHTPADISAYLFHIWQWRELTEWAGYEFIPSLKAQEPTPAKRITTVLKTNRRAS